MTESVRVPMALAAKKGVFALAAMSQSVRLLLTSGGRAVAVVDSAERLDADVQRMREATWALLEAAAHLVGERSTAFDLDAVCKRVGIDPQRVRDRSSVRRRDAEDGDKRSAQD